MRVSKIEAQKKCVKDGDREKVWSKMAAQRAGQANLPGQKHRNTCADSLNIGKETVGICF